MGLPYILKCGDCVEILNKQKEEFVDLVITSPPYDNLREYNGYVFNYQPVVKAIYRCLKPGGVCVWVVADQTTNGSESGSSFKQSIYAKQIGFNLHDTMIYAKNNYVPLTKNRYEQAFEYIMVWSKGKPNTFNALMVPCSTAGLMLYNTNFKAIGEKNYSMRYREPTIVKDTKIAPNIFYYTIGRNEGNGHPAPFPYQLAIDQIESWSNIGDLVLDPMMGGCTSGVAAKALSRKFIGIDVSQEYVNISENRLKECLNQNHAIPAP